MSGGRESPGEKPPVPAGRPPEISRARVVITGQVQGVCFRAEAQREAARLGVRGWVRNRADGAVEGVLEGPRRVVEELIGWCQRGPPHARVEEVEVEWETPTREFGGFGIRY